MGTLWTSNELASYTQFIFNLKEFSVLALSQQIPILHLVIIISGKHFDKWSS